MKLITNKKDLKGDGCHSYLVLFPQFSEEDILKWKDETLRDMAHWEVARWNEMNDSFCFDVEYINKEKFENCEAVFELPSTHSEYRSSLNRGDLEAENDY